MANNQSGLPDQAIIVWADGPMSVKYYPHGHTLNEERVAFCKSPAEAEATVVAMVNKFPGCSVFTAAAISKRCYKSVFEGSFTITDKGEVLPE